MHILLIGTTHRQSSLSLREKINPEILSKKISANFFPKIISEYIIVSTCNRVEIYAVTENIAMVEKKIKKLFSVKHISVYKDSEAVKHVFTVVSGMDSLVLGESEIQSQIKQAYMDGIEKNTIGPILHKLFKDSLQVGKQIRSTTRIGSGVTSVAHAAVLLAKKNVVKIEQKKVLVIGAGIMGQRVIKNLLQYGIADISLINRTDKKSLSLAKELQIKSVAFNNFDKMVRNSDMIFATTTSPTPIITKAMVKKVFKKSSTKPVYFIDLAVPRDIDPKINEIKHMHVYNLDEIQKFVEKNTIVRKSAVKDAETKIENETNKFWQWYQSRKTVPLITAFNDRATAIRDAELKRTFNKLSHLNLNDHDKKIIAALSNRIVDKLLATPIARIKTNAGENSNQIYMEALKEIFNLEN